jgi:hypothetical protein
LVERRGKRTARTAPFRLGLVELAIDIPADLALFPLGGEGVEIVREGALFQLEGRAGVFFGQVPPWWRVPWAFAGSWPTSSMMSISPLEAQPP